MSSWCWSRGFCLFWKTRIILGGDAFVHAVPHFSKSILIDVVKTNKRMCFPCLCLLTAQAWEQPAGGAADGFWGGGAEQSARQPGDRVEAGASVWARERSKDRRSHENLYDSERLRGPGPPRHGELDDNFRTNKDLFLRPPWCSWQQRLWQSQHMAASFEHRCMKIS